MTLLLYQVDAFTGEAFRGNPAAVCLLDEPRPDAWLQAVAAEMNLSETAFLLPGSEAFGLRWFTPTVEVDLCGHATLASAHVLWQTGRVQADDAISFQTRSGHLTARRRGGLIELDFPADLATPAAPAGGLLEALGVNPRAVSRGRFDYLIELTDEAALRAVAPDFSLLGRIDVRGVIVTSPCSSGFDFVSRFFAPAAGINEDPVTGSAHCTLATYWAEKLGKQAMTAYQASVRGGIVHVRLAGDRVVLGGEAVTVFKAELLADALPLEAKAAGDGGAGG